MYLWPGDGTKWLTWVISKKMFNPVLLQLDDQVFHRFLWRSDKSEMPSVFQWLRLNFGNRSASDIALNAINYLATVSQVVEFPDTAQELQDDITWTILQARKAT